MNRPGHTDQSHSNSVREMKLILSSTFRHNQITIANLANNQAFSQYFIVKFFHFFKANCYKETIGKYVLTDNLLKISYLSDLSLVNP